MFNGLDQLYLYLGVGILKFHIDQGFLLHTIKTTSPT